VTSVPYHVEGYGGVIPAPPTAEAPAPVSPNGAADTPAEAKSPPVGGA
jgi:hypothetical protein